MSVVLNSRMPCMVMSVVACAQYAPVGQTWRDPESLEDVPLVPGMTPMENQLRWGFVQKVSPACSQVESIMFRHRSKHPSSHSSGHRLRYAAMKTCVGPEHAVVV